MEWKVEIDHEFKGKLSAGKKGKNALWIILKMNLESEGNVCWMNSQINLEYKGQCSLQWKAEIDHEVKGKLSAWKKGKNALWMWRKNACLIYFSDTIWFQWKNCLLNMIDITTSGNEVIFYDQL